MRPQKIANTYITIALLLFFMSATYGWLMRLSSLTIIPFFDYTRFLQAHSHVTFLGWGFIGVTTLFNYLFLDPKKSFGTKFKWIFSVELLSVFLMLISFPLQGYKLYSIILLSVFLMTSYFYVFHFFKQFKSQNQPQIVKLFVNTSLLFYVVSSVGIWAIGIVVGTQGKTDLYYNSIYFYLHFLYNGFFVFALFGIFVFYLFKIKLDINKHTLNMFFWLTALTCVPAYVLSLIESENVLVISIGFITAFVQLVSLIYLMKLVIAVTIFSKHKWGLISKLMFNILILAYVLKISLQFGSSFPQVTDLIINLKSFFVIGYIHLVTLGFLTPFLLFLLVQLRFFKMDNQLMKWGILSLLLGVLITEMLLFGQGVLISLSFNPLPNYSFLLFSSSSLLLLGIALIYIAKINRKG